MDATVKFKYRISGKLNQEEREKVQADKELMVISEIEDDIASETNEILSKSFESNTPDINSECIQKIINIY